jgi:hypothetical protein
MKWVSFIPDRVELAILTALADTYSAETLTNTSFANDAAGGRA